MRPPLAPRIASALIGVLAAVTSVALLGGSSCQVSTTWCHDEHCLDGCDCDGGSCCSAGTCCDGVPQSAPQPPGAVIVTTDAHGEEQVWLDARGRVVRIDARRSAAPR